MLLHNTRIQPEWLVELAHGKLRSHVKTRCFQSLIQKPSNVPLLLSGRDFFQITSWRCFFLGMMGLFFFFRISGFPSQEVFDSFPEHRPFSHSPEVLLGTWQKYQLGKVQRMLAAFHHFSTSYVSWTTRFRLSTSPPIPCFFWRLLHRNSP